MAALRARLYQSGSAMIQERVVRNALRGLSMASGRRWYLPAEEARTKRLLRRLARVRRMGGVL